MEATPEAEWPDEFTREEMLEQQSNLLIEECRMLQDEVSRYRQNLAKLIDMNATVTSERDNLRKTLGAAERRVSELIADKYEQSRRIGSLQSIIDQHKMLLREHKVPGHYVESEPYEPLPINARP